LSIWRIAKEIFESSLLSSPPEALQKDYLPLLDQTPTKKANLQTPPFFSHENVDVRVDPVMNDMQLATPSLISDQHDVPVTPPSPARLTSMFNNCFDTPQRHNATQPLVDSLASKTGFVRRILNLVKKAKRKVEHAANASASYLSNSVQNIWHRTVLKKRPAAASQQMRQTQTRNNSDSNSQESQTQTQEDSVSNTQEESTELPSQAIGTQTHTNSDFNTQESQTQTQDNSNYNTQEESAAQEESTKLLLQALGILNGVLQAEEVNDLTTSKQLNALAVTVLAKASGNDEDVVELKCVIPTAKGHSTKAKMFAEIPFPRRPSTKEPEEKSKQNKTKQLNEEQRKLGRHLKGFVPGLKTACWFSSSS
jgi:hypothetical protein